MKMAIQSCRWTAALVLGLLAAGSASTAAATSAAYSAGIATGATMAGAPASGAYVMGVNDASLPTGSTTIDKNGGTYYFKDTDLH